MRSTALLRELENEQTVETAKRCWKGATRYEAKTVLQSLNLEVEEPTILRVELD